MNVMCCYVLHGDEWQYILLHVVLFCRNSNALHCRTSPQYLSAPTTSHVRPSMGSVEIFWTFTRAFEHSVENCTNDNSARLTRLTTYWQSQKGHCMLLCNESWTGILREQKSSLEQHFENVFLIAQAWIKKVTCGRPIGPRDKESLQDLTDDRS